MTTRTFTCTLPLLTLQGNAHENGLVHGEKLRREIDHNVSVYYKRFNNETKLAKDEVRTRAEKYSAVIQRKNPEYYEEIRGVATGSGFDLLDIVALNVRYELMYSQFSKLGVPAASRVDGCTALGIMPGMSENGHMLLAQNWDWIPEVKGAFLRIEKDLGPSVLCFTEAGVVGGKIGMNSNGLGMLVNGLVSTNDDWSRLEKPFHVQCWEALRSDSIEEAVKIVSKGKRACSANFVFGEQRADKTAAMVDVESAPDAANRIDPDKGIIIHTNHFCNPSAVGITQVIDEEWRSTLTRYDRIARLVAERDGRKFDLDGLKTTLRDHYSRPNSICRHPDESLGNDDRYKSVVSVVMDLHDRKLWATNGSPCENEYELLGF